jgi:hypothetical protein
MKQIVVCGCSFSIGIGCLDLYTEPYSSLVAKEFNCDLINLSRGGASNYAIYLQGLFAADLESKPDLVILSQTSYDRLEWVMEGRNADAPHSLLNLNYHQYPPFNHPPSPQHTKPLDFYINDHPNYDPFILCEQVGGIDDYLKCLKRKDVVEYYKRLHTEPVKKLELMRDRYVSSESYVIKKNRDIALLVQAYYYIKRKNIRCLILTEDENIFSQYIDESDVMYQSWGSLTVKYPDTVNSGHTSPIGHIDTANRVIAKIKENVVID